MSLSGLKVIEFAGLAPGPFAGLVLADNGASVTRIDRPSASSLDILCRGKRSIAINPKVPSGREVLKKLIAAADVLIDPYRPGVMERLGLGPEVFLGDGTNKGLNERLIYARIVGFSRTGPYKDMAGHDVNYLALSGVLSMLPGQPEKPSFPLNLLADFAGGGMMCALNILLALIERGKTGHGQIVDTDMVSGTRYVSSFPLLHIMDPSTPLFGTGSKRGRNILDGGAPFYSIYACSDGKWMSVACLEPAFFAAFLDKFLEGLPKIFTLDDGWVPTRGTQTDRSEWPRLKLFLERGFMTNTRDYWAATFFGSDACAVPVLTPTEAETLNPSRLPSAIQPRHLTGRGPSETTVSTFQLEPGQHTIEILNELGLDESHRKSLVEDGALEDPHKSVNRGVKVKL